MNWWKFKITGNNGFTFNFANYNQVFVSNWLGKLCSFEIISICCFAVLRHTFSRISAPRPAIHPVQSENVIFLFRRCCFFFRWFFPLKIEKSSKKWREKKKQQRNHDRSARRYAWAIHDSIICYVHIAESIYSDFQMIWSAGNECLEVAQSFGIVYPTI